MLVLGLADNMRGPAFPDVLKEFSLSDSRGSLFFLLASAGGLVANLASVWWLKRWGPVRAIKIFQVSMSIGLIAISFSNGLWVLFTGMVFVGFSFGGTGITQNILVAWGAKHEMRRRSYSTLHAIYGFASLSAPLLLISFYHFKLTWQNAFLAIGVLSCLVNLWSLFVAEQRDDPPFPAPSFRKSLVSRRTIYWFAMMNSLYVIAELLIGTRLVLLARREWEISPDEANQLLSLFYLLLLAGRLTMSFVHFKTKTKNLMIGSIACSLVIFCIGIFTHPWVIALCGLSMSIFYPCAIAFTYEEQAIAADGIIAWTMTLNSAAVLLMHVGVGWLSDIIGLRVAIWIGPVSLLLCLVLLLLEKKLVPSGLRPKSL